MRETEKPYVILSAAMTIDGKIASKTGDPELSDELDWREVHKLRSNVDGIMVGKNTILNDNPKLHIKFYKHDGYKRIVVDSNLSVPIDSQVITFQPEIYSTIICTTENTPTAKIKDFELRGVKIIKSGKGKKVNIPNLLPLYNEVIKQKTVINTFEITHLKINEIKCPYCREITSKLLPYIDKFLTSKNSILCFLIISSISSI